MENVILQEDFKRLVGEQLAEQKLSRSELARLMEVSPQYVTNYLKGYNSPGADVMERFFTALGVRARLTLEPNATKASSPRKPRRPSAATAVG